MDSELRHLERLLARAGLRLYEVSIGRHEDHRVEVLAYGPPHDLAWFQEVHDRHDDARRRHLDLLKGELGLRREVEGTPEFEAWERLWNMGIARFRAEHGGSFQEHLVIEHGFIVPAVVSFNLEDV